MRLPRMTTRRWMLVIVFVALGISVPMQAMRAMALARDYQDRSLSFAEDAARTRLCEQVHRRRSRGFKDAAEEVRKGPPWKRATDGYSRESLAAFHESAAEEHRRFAAWHSEAAARSERLAIKYRRAARWPWLGVEPDPPLAKFDGHEWDACRTFGPMPMHLSNP
jgi:hypothetical protein